jgi:hypothetical protein
MVKFIYLDQSESSNSFFLFFAEGLEGAFFAENSSSSPNRFFFCAGFYSILGTAFFGMKAASYSSSSNKFFFLVGDYAFGG